MEETAETMEWDEVRLSPRLREMFALLLTGASEKEIAHQLGISQHTVHDHVKTLYKKLGVRSRLQLMARALRRA